MSPPIFLRPSSLAVWRLAARAALSRVKATHGHRRRDRIHWPGMQTFVVCCCVKNAQRVPFKLEKILGEENV
jgi:hypothetical protein